MKKKYGVVGYKGKIGSLLLERDDFVFIDCDVTDLDSVVRGIGYKEELDIVVNCAAISSIDECETNYKTAMEVNVTGLANLHRVFGERVLSLSSDHIFDGRAWLLPKETIEKAPAPVNAYGITKFAAEGVSEVFGGKTIRMSRVVSLMDSDIQAYLGFLKEGMEIRVPDFFSRNYLHKEYAVDGIEYMVRNWEDMPKLVNYAGTENVTMYSFIKILAIELGLPHQLVTKQREYNDKLVPRPRKGGLNVGLAKSLGFPMYTISDTVSKLAKNYHA